MTFMKKITFPLQKNCHFILFRNDDFHDNASKNDINSKKYYAEIFIKTNVIETQSQHWYVNIQLSMEGVFVEYFTNSIDPDRNRKKQNFIHI